MFLSDSIALMRLSDSPAFEMTSGRLLIRTSKRDCSDGITGYLRLAVAIRGSDARLRGRRSTNSRPVTPCSVRRATVSPPIGASSLMSATTRTRCASRGSMPMLATRPTTTPR